VAVPTGVALTDAAQGGRRRAIASRVFPQWRTDMVDVITSILAGTAKRFRDMGDGTHAEVVLAVDGGPRYNAASSAPLTGTANASVTTPAFTPQPGREIVLTLSGAWSGTVSLLRSVDGGTTKLPATLASAPLIWSGNLNELVWVETEAAATLYLDIALASGTVTYRVSQ